VYAVHHNVGGNGFFSASKDRKIYHIDGEGNPAKLFEGHENVVNSLSQSVDGELVSGSWDGTAIVWDTNTGKVIAKLEGHAHAVAVLSLPNGIIITGSQDKSIRLWFKHSLQKEIPNAHEDIIR
jgi:WD40 repeat protein